MSSPVGYPALSSDGWVFDDSIVADYLFSDIYLSDYSQTQFYKGYVTSIGYVVQENSGSVSDTVIALRTAINDYFSRYFTSVVVETEDITKESDGSKANISIYVAYTDYQGNNKVLAKVLTTLNGKATSITEYSNYGT